MLSASQGLSRARRPLWRAEGALLAATVFSPLALGSTQPWQLLVVLALLGTAVGTLWGSAAVQLAPPAIAVAVALALLPLWLAFQNVPLPQVLLHWLSPHTADIYALSLRGTPGLQGLHPLTLDGPGTAAAFSQSVALALTFWVGAALGVSRRRRVRLASAVALAGLAVALIGIGHQAFEANSLFGSAVFTPGAGFVTTLRNSNHAAGLLLLAANLSLGLALRSRRVALTLWGLAYLTCGSGVFLTLSRGGVLAFVASQVALAALLARRPNAAQPYRNSGLAEPTPPTAQRGRGQPFEASVPRLAVAGRQATERRSYRALRWTPLIPAAVALAAVLAGGGALAFRPLADRFLSLTSRQEIERQGKLSTVLESLPMLRDFPLTGIGRGAYPTVSGRYVTSTPQTAEYVENEPLQWLIDLGIPVGLGLIAVLAWALVQAALRRPRSPLGCALWSGLFGLALQNTVDFSMEITGVALPATLTLALLLAGEPAEVANASPRHTPARTPQALRLALSALVPVALVALIYGRHRWRGDTDAFAVAAPGWNGPRAEAEALPLLRRHPASFLVPLALADRYLAQGDAARALDFVGRAMELKPNLAIEHLIAARAWALAGDPADALREARFTYLAGDTHRALEVMLRSYPTLDELRQAVPASGDGLLDLAALLQQHGRKEDAATVALQAEATDPSSAPLELRVAQLLADDASAAALHAQRAVDLAPRDAAGYLSLATAQRTSGNLSAAQQTLQRGLQQCPGDADLAMALVRADLALQQPTRAEADLKSLQPFGDPAQRAGAFALEGEIFAAEGRSVRAEDSYRAAARLQPGAGYEAALLAQLEASGNLAGEIEVLRQLAHRQSPSQRANIEQQIAQLEHRRELQRQAALGAVP